MQLVVGKPLRKLNERDLEARMMAWGWGEGDSLRETGSVGLGGEEMGETREKGSGQCPGIWLRLDGWDLPLSVGGSTGKKQVMESTIHKRVGPMEHPGGAVS